ncbi:MAG: cellulose biosynthesis protein CelD [Rhizobiales bacterium 62-17]|nr:GNAT family N-acetyltransferase [Hyphomicrobiales bacterium]OJY02314.1 MAG: cellulose biosynthesis protein CelD [Rhizobiales bacterium 62-17]
MFEVTIENSFDFRSQDYARLFANSAATAFQHPIWLANLYDKLIALNDVEPLVIVVRMGADGRLAMVLPLVKRRYAMLKIVGFADMDVSDYISPVVDHATFQRIIDDPAAIAAIGNCIRPYDILRIGKIVDPLLPLERLFNVSARASMNVSAYASKLEPNFAAWREMRLSRSYRKRLDKKSRQLHRMGGVSFSCVETPTAIQTVFDALRIYRGKRFDGRRGPADLLQLPSYCTFYAAVATEGQGRFARTYAIWRDGRPIAGALGLAHRNVFLVILVGFDAANYARQSIGSLLFEKIAEDCIRRGEDYLDFTIGDEPYKRKFGGRASPMWQVHQIGSFLGGATQLVIDKLPMSRAVAGRLIRNRSKSRSETVS